jgi:hypothetical protein
MREYKVIVAGGRDFNDEQRFEQVICDYAEKTDAMVSIITGMARGADRLAYEFARRNKVQWYEFHADWDKYGKRAGYVRNGEMAKEADALIAFWDGESRGTRNMIELMRNMGKPVHVELY